MKRVTLAVVLVLAFVFGYSVVRSTADGTMAKSEPVSDVSKLFGTTVKDSRGEDLGTIVDTVTGPEGRVAFAILSYWISDDAQKRVAVPLGALSCEGLNCVLNASKETLDSAPLFISEDDLAEPRMAADIYRYFGVPPYWTEEGTEK